MVWPKKCNSVEFDNACSTYDNSMIVNEGLNKLDIDCEVIYISNLLRSKETASLLFPNGRYIEEKIEEVPLKSYKDSQKKQPLWIWNFCGRMQWYFNNHRQEEVRQDTIRRCNQVISMLSEKGENCALMTHGFFMRTFIKCLKKQGYHVKGNSLAVSNLQIIIAEQSL